MNLETLAQVGEFVGGISVIATLIYLAIQIRGNSRAVRSAGAQQTHDTLIQAYFQLASDTKLNRIVRLGTQDISTLNEDETGQFFAFWSGVLYLAQNWLYQRDKGALEDELVDTFLVGVAANFHAGGFQMYWNERRFTFSTNLRDWVEKIIKNGPQRPSHQVLQPGKSEESGDL